MAYDYDHTDASNLNVIAYQVAAVSDHVQAAHIAAFVIAERMMIPQNWGLKFVTWLARLRHPKSNGYAVLAVTLRKPACRELCFEMLRQTLEHLANGKDQSDPSSAGGFNREELQKFIVSCQAVGAL